MAIKVIIADDHSMIREGLKQLLELDDMIDVVGQAENGQECIKLLRHTEADVVLLDINMPIMNGLEVLEKIKKTRMRVKVLILTIHNEVDYLIKAVDIGCNGYVLKDSNSDVLKNAIYAVHMGESFIQPDLIPILNAGLAQRDMEDDSVNTLTKREKEVLILIAEGLFNKEVAIRLDISERTVKNHVSSIFKKIGVSDRTQAAVFAIKNNLIDLY